MKTELKNIELLADSRDKVIDMPQGYLLSWFCTPQAAFRITVTLKDECTTYFSGSKASTDINPPLAQGSAVQLGKELRMLIDIPQSVKIRMESNKNFVEVDGKEVARCYTWLIEDQDDDDFNDMHLSLIGWKKKG